MTVEAKLKKLLEILGPNPRTVWLIHPLTKGRVTMQFENLKEYIRRFPEYDRQNKAVLLHFCNQVWKILITETKSNP